LHQILCLWIFFYWLNWIFHLFQNGFDLNFFVSSAFLLLIPRDKIKTLRSFWFDDKPFGVCSFLEYKLPLQKISNDQLVISPDAMLWMHRTTRDNISSYNAESHLETKNCNTVIDYKYCNKYPYYFVCDALILFSFSFLFFHFSFDPIPSFPCQIKRSFYDEYFGNQHSGTATDRQTKRVSQQIFIWTFVIAGTVFNLRHFKRVFIWDCQNDFLWIFLHKG